MSENKDEIINRVAQSKLITFNLEDYYPQGKRVILDVKDWLYEGFILKEKEFRAHVAGHDWEQYTNAYIALSCSTDAIIPGWAYMLITSRLQPYAKTVVVGGLEELETSLYQSVIETIDVSSFIDQMVIVKGCSNKPVPPNAYVWITAKIQTVAKSVMYGEACSSVPLFKRK
jgi:S-adenosylmethionine/arginine decarboxylase-like enzyme